MAPEQTERNAVTPAADVWAIGLIAFFLLTGKPFWLSANAADSSVQQVMREVIFEPIPRASERAKELGARDVLPPWFDAWFARCVARAPKSRLPNAHEVFATLARYADDPESAPSTVPSADAVVSAPLTTNLSDSVAPSAASSSPNAVIIAGTVPSAPTLLAPTRPEDKRVHVRPTFVFVALFVLAAAAILLRLELKGETPIEQTPLRSDQDLALPDELKDTKGAAWFARVRGRCNPVQIELLLKQDPPPEGTDGVGFAAACLSLAGKIDDARARISALPEHDRGHAVWPVFEVIHPIADSGDDAAAGPGMRLVIDFWPDNYMALYHAGMAEYGMHEPRLARAHLTRFLELYKKPDGFTQSARTVLSDLERPEKGAVDCKTPITVDPEGHKVFPARCAKKL
jgi:hypothetical protein